MTSIDVGHPRPWVHVVPGTVLQGTHRIWYVRCQHCGGAENVAEPQALSGRVCQCVERHNECPERV